ncbi:hypothetical protein IFM89_029044 [Coptis chinensis]|uniref:Uncharacterized protein n=1 Tax=Coptis chinensis TaxID=261450 RepID=A0A835M1K5_9MAGN|nr:hypothetical protein IFM89_029044 [Coptis chinensis]
MEKKVPPLLSPKFDFASVLSDSSAKCSLRIGSIKGALKSIRTYMGPVHIKDIALAQILLYENSAASDRHLCVEAIRHFSDFAAGVAKLYP